MRATSLIPFLLAACAGANDSLTAEQELLVSATSGAEEAFASTAVSGEMPTSDGRDQPPLMRECDAEGSFVGLFEEYDADGDGELGPPEEDEVFGAREGRDQMEARNARDRMHLLGLIYDTDRDGELSDSEKAVLFDDFTVRCEVLHERLLADFDADGDGELSDSELATAEASMQEMMEAQRAEMEANRPEGDGPPMGEERPDPDAVPEPLSDFDTNGDGTWSEAELAALREELRAHIRAGDPLCGPPPESVDAG